MTDLPLYTKTAVADPNLPQNVLRPNADGSINVEGDLTISPDSNATAIAYGSYQQLQQLVALETQIRNGLLLLLNLTAGSKLQQFSISDLTGDF